MKSQPGKSLSLEWWSLHPPLPGAPAWCLHGSLQDSFISSSSSSCPTELGAALVPLLMEQAGSLAQGNAEISPKSSIPNGWEQLLELLGSIWWLCFPFLPSRAAGFWNWWQ